MPSDLLVPLPGCGAFLKIEPFEDRVLPVLLLDIQNCGLHPLFPLRSCGLLFPLLLRCSVVRKEIQLLLCHAGGFLFRQHPIGGDVDAPDQQARVYDPVKEGGGSGDDGSGGGGVGFQIDRPVGVLGDGPAIPTEVVGNTANAGVSGTSTVSADQSAVSAALSRGNLSGVSHIERVLLPSQR